MQYIKDYWFIISGVIIPVATYIVGTQKNKLEKYKKKEEVQNKALRNMLKSNLVNQYYAYKNIGKVPKFIKEAWYSMYESYVDLGGNSFIRDDIKPKWDSLEIED